MRKCEPFLASGGGGGGGVGGGGGGGGVALPISQSKANPFWPDRKSCLGLNKPKCNDFRWITKARLVTSCLALFPTSNLIVAVGDRQNGIIVVHYQVRRSKFSWAGLLCTPTNLPEKPFGPMNRSNRRSVNRPGFLPGRFGFEVSRSCRAPSRNAPAVRSKNQSIGRFLFVLSQSYSVTQGRRSIPPKAPLPPAFGKSTTARSHKAKFCRFPVNN